MSPLLSHALFWGVLFATGWLTYVACVAVERRHAARCVRRCCVATNSEAPRDLAGSRGFESNPSEGAEL